MLDFNKFANNYNSLMLKVYEKCEHCYIGDDSLIIICASAMINAELESVVNQYSNKFNNPYLACGKVQKKLFV